MLQTRKIVITLGLMGTMSSMNIAYAEPGIVSVYLEPESCTLQVWCDKDISNVAYLLNTEEFHKNDNLSGHHYSMNADNVDTIWVKCGNNHKRGKKNKGLGEAFQVSDLGSCGPID